MAQLQKLDAMAKPRSDESIRKAEERKKQREDKDLLLRDLCARLPYGVIMTNIKLPNTYYPLTCEDLHDAMYDDDWDDVPYLRPLSSMTEEEQKEFVKFHCVNICPIVITEELTISNESEMFDWLNKKMFDYRGLIPKGLAVEVTEDNNPYKD